MSDYNLFSWVNENEKESSFDYWNNEEIEKNKVFSIENDKSFEKLDKHKHLNDIYFEINKLIKKEKIDFNDKNILSLGCGTAYIEGKVLQNYNFKKLTLVDFSKHRILSLAPKTINYFINDVSKINFIHGSMYELKMKDHSLDIIILSQSFHHVEEPLRLLRSMKRKLKPEGIIIIVEPYFNNISFIKHYMIHLGKFLLNHKNYRKYHSFLPSYNDLFPPCLIKGDIHYSSYDYHIMFNKYNFNYINIISPSKNIQTFLLKNNS